LKSVYNITGDGPLETASVDTWLLPAEISSLENLSTTVTSFTVNTTTPNVTGTTSSPSCHYESQHFDAASFIGGMVLAFGVVGIFCFMKLYFQTQHDEQYHTL